MNVLMDFEGRLLSSREIEEMMKTESGCKLIKEYALSAKIAHAAQSVFDYMTEIDKKPSEMTDEEIQNVCNVMYHDFKYTRWDKIEQYLHKIVSLGNRKAFEDFFDESTPVC